MLLSLVGIEASDKNISVPQRTIDKPLLWEPGLPPVKYESIPPVQDLLFSSEEIKTYYYMDPPLLWEPKAPLIEFDTIPPFPIYILNCDGSTYRARVIDLPDNDNVRTNLNIITMQNQSFNYVFKYNEKQFVSCKTPQIDWELKVVDPRSDALAILEFSDCANNSDTITVKYFAPKVIISPDYANFGIVKKGNSVFRDFWLVNKGNDTSIIKKLELKDKTQGFSISEVSLPITIPPMDSVKFTVNFTATEEGKYIDSIGIGNGCIFFNVAKVETDVRQSIINVSDALFEDLPIKTTATKIVEIKNYGTVDLIITGYKGPNNPAYKTDLPEISELKPLTIKPDDPPYKFKVEFSPLLEEVYHDSIVFFSDAFVTDSIAILNGNGIQPGMISTSFDWGRRRIGNEYPAGNQSITIENTSDGDVTIYGFATKVNKGGDVFIFDWKHLENVTIPSGENIYVPVKFKPLDTGRYELVLVYDNSINSQTETRLSGVGVLPIMETSNVVFDTSVVGKYPYPINDTVRFKNVDWEYGDTIKINDLKILPNGDEISPDSNWSRLGFKFDKKALRLPRILLPGDELEIPILFVARDTGIVSAAIKTVSDIEPEDTAHIYGIGVNERLEVYVKQPPPSICLGNQDTIDYFVENAGNTFINVTSLNIKDSSQQFGFIDSSNILGFDMNPGNKVKVSILYKPNLPGISLADFIVYNDTKFNSIAHNKLEGEGIQKKRNLRVELTQDNYNVQIGSAFQCNIFLEPGDDIDVFDIKELALNIKYNGGIIKAEPDEIRIGELLEGKFQINELGIKDNPGIIRLKLDTLRGIPNERLSGAGEILKIIFHAYLPNSKDSSNLSIIDPTVIPITNQCVDFSDKKTITVQIDPVCMNDIMKISINSLNYGLGAINPNPVGAGNSKVYYSIGLDGNTKFEILNYDGSSVYTVTFTNQKSGVYNFDIPSAMLGSGVYWCRMTSGPFSSIKEFVIIK